MTAEADTDGKPVVLIAGAAGNLGRSVAGALGDSYTIVGLDREAGDGAFPIIEADLTSEGSIGEALEAVGQRWGGRFASVIHLAAYFDFSGEQHPLYEELNVEGTRLLIRALQKFQVEQFLYAGTMLVHAPVSPGERIDEQQEIDPRWAYPDSKAAAEQAIWDEAGEMPVCILRLAGVYDRETMVPTLAQQIARIFEKNVQSRFYSGNLDVGQAMLHREDMLDAFRRATDRRAELPQRTELLIGEPEAPGYGELQNRIGCLIHGEKEWTTWRLPKPLAAAGAAAMAKLEPIIPDAIDKGEEPFVKPFMVRMADDHYALDIGRARDLLGWVPGRRLKDELPAMIAALKRDPKGWYEANGVTSPEWLSS